MILMLRASFVLRKGPLGARIRLQPALRAHNVTLGFGQEQQEFALEPDAVTLRKVRQV